MGTAWTITAEECCKRLETLKGERSNFDSQWQEIKNILYPDSGDFTTTRSQGEKLNLEIFDASPTLYLEHGASALETFLTPRTQRWSRLVASDPNLMKVAAVKEWFEDANDVLFKWRNNPRARFHSTLHEGHKSTLAYGNACQYVSQMKGGGTQYRPVHIGTAWFDTDESGWIDTLYYQFPLTARAAHQRWGDKIPRKIRDSLEAKPMEIFQFLHVVIPNDDYVPGKIDAQSRLFATAEIAIEAKEVMQRDGEFEMPYQWPRYTVNPAEKYGRGPGGLLLPDLKTLQAMERTFLRSGQKIADPPLLAANDGILGRGNKRIDLRSGRVTMGGLDNQGRPLVAPLVTGGRIDMTESMMDRRRQLIRSAFGVDYFELLVQDRTTMTATEVLERAREKGQLIAPVIGRQQSELLGPMIDREIKIALRSNKLGRMPQELIEAEGEYEIEYESDATRMQKASEALAFSRTFETLGVFFQANPSLLEKFKQTDAIDSVFEINGGSSKLIRTEQEFAKMQAIHAQQEAQAVQQQQAATGAKTLRDVGAAAKSMAA